ncbi:MAG: exo-alpha-sialidase [Acidobacteria bacterium]|nr:exo-alpha-sialidase [Acidobacteriota bacterium]MBI3654995.1 exo-alpha-sialidase [Acidobacteriota bacterium]
MGKIKRIVSLIIISLSLMILVLPSEGLAQSFRERLWNIRNRLSGGAYAALYGRRSPIVQTKNQTTERIVPLAPDQPCTNPPCLGPERLVNDRTQPGLTQSETAVAAFRQKVVAGWNDSGSFFGEPSLSGYGYSTDGGANWTDGGEIQRTADGVLQPTGDPWLDANNSGHFFYSTLLLNDRWTLSSLGVAKSIDGVTFASPVEAIPRSSTLFFDKEALAVDKTGGATSGYIYMSYTVFTSFLFSTGQIEIVRSTDEGATWGPRIVIRAEETLVNQGSMPAVGPNGEVYAVWERGWQSTPNQASIVMSKSTDAGQTWGPMTTIADICSIAFNPPSGYNRIVINDFPQIAVDNGPGSPRRGYVYVTWHDCRATGSTSDPDIYVSRSTDGGSTWSAPIRVNENNPIDRQFFPSISIDGIGNMHVIFYDRSENPGTAITNTFYLLSTDGGLTFRPLKRTGHPDGQLSEQANDWNATQSDMPPNFGDYIKNAAFGTNIHNTWADGRLGDPDVFARKVISPFVDNFDDAASGSRFFSNTETGTRWAVAPPAAGALCDLLVQTLVAPDQVCEVKFSGIAGVAGATYSSASYKKTYTPDGQEETMSIRVATPDGTDLSDKKGRIGDGIIGQTNLVTRICQPTGLNYDEHQYTASVVGGLELDSRVPWIIFNPLFSEVTFPPIPSLVGVIRLTIAMTFTGGGVTLKMTISDTDELLFQGFAAWPVGFTWSGTQAGCFLYYGIANNSGTLFVQDFTVDIP